MSNPTAPTIRAAEPSDALQDASSHPVEVADAAPGINNLVVIQNITLPSIFTGPNLHNLILAIFDKFFSQSISAPNPNHNSILIFIIRCALESNLNQLMLPIEHLFLNSDEILIITLTALRSIGIILI